METSQLERPVLAVDVVIVGIKAGRLEVLFARRPEAPFQGTWALPGVAVRIDETLANAARRALQEKAGWLVLAPPDFYLEQLAAFDALDRDPRGRTVSVAYLGLARRRPEHHADVLWRGVAEMTNAFLPFDHQAILDTAIMRLRGKLRYTNIAKELLPEIFRIEELQEVYEAILGRAVNRTNFRSKLLKIQLIEQVRVLNTAVGKQGGRPPHLYRFLQPQLESAARDFL